MDGRDDTTDVPPRSPSPAHSWWDLLPHASLLDVHDALVLQIREHPWSGDDATLTYHYCACPRCDSLERLRQALIDWALDDLVRMGIPVR